MGDVPRACTTSCTEESPIATTHRQALFCLTFSGDTSIARCHSVHVPSIYILRYTKIYHAIHFRKGIPVIFQCGRPLAMHNIPVYESFFQLGSQSRPNAHPWSRPLSCKLLTPLNQVLLFLLPLRGTASWHSVSDMVNRFATCRSALCT